MRRKVEFLPDGKPVLVTSADVVAFWRRHSTVSATYALATSEHESSRQANEVDTEPSGFMSYGLMQVSREEAAHVGMVGADLLDPETNIIVLAHLVDERAAAINRVLGRPQRSPNDGIIIPPEPDFLAYLTIAHNQGLGACVKTISAHGMDWASYKSRNLTAAQGVLASAQSAEDIAAATTKLAWWQNVFAYGDDCISGGSTWDPAFDPPVAA